MCPNYAAECSDLTTATKCIDGYFLSNNECSKCSTGAKTCESASKVTECLNTYFKSGDTCTKCDQANVLKCDSATNILSC